MRALITGGAGFIGLHLARRLLRDGVRVDLLDDFSRGRRDPELDALSARKDVTLVAGSLSSADVAAKISRDYDVIFHFAAIVGVQNVVERPYETLAGNIALTTAAIDLAKSQRALKRFVFASTSEVYAGSFEKFTLPIPTPETAPLALPDLDAPRTSYMLSKICGESLCAYSGLPTTIVRPHNVYGPRMGSSHVIPQMISRAIASQDGDEFAVYSADHTRTFCFIDDAVEIVARASVSPDCVGRTLNLGSAAPEIRIETLAGIVARVVGRRLRLVSHPAHPGSPARRCPDMALTTSLVGFAAKVPLETGVEQTYAWYRDRVAT